MALEAKLISTGSVTKVTDEKNWDRAMNTHKSMLEALERLLYEKFWKPMNHSREKKPTEVLKITMTKSKLTELLSSHDVFLGGFGFNIFLITSYSEEQCIMES